MNDPHYRAWHGLLARSAPAFAAETEPPYGFVTQTMARLREQRRQEALGERIGLRAIFVSLALVAVAAAVTLDRQMGDREDLDPGVKSMALVENVQVS